jgi:hypothetical protein
MLLRLGDPPVPVPEPVITLLVEHTANRANMGTATNPNSTWLFPGRRAGQPLRPEVLGEDMRAAGLPTVLGRTAALRQLVLQAPTPVVADMLGFHPVHPARVHAQADSTWNRYAPETTGDIALTGDPKPQPPRQFRSDDYESPPVSRANVSLSDGGPAEIEVDVAA